MVQLAAPILHPPINKLKAEDHKVLLTAQYLHANGHPDPRRPDPWHNPEPNPSPQLKAAPQLKQEVRQWQAGTVF